MSTVWWLIVAVLGLSLVWLLAYVSNVAAVQTVVLPILLLLAVSAAFGFSAGKTVAFAILYLYFALPALDHLQFIFQTITTNVVHLLIRIADLPAYVEGNFVQLSAGTFEIAGGCAGLAFILAGLSLAALYAHLFYRVRRNTAVLIVITLAVAMVGNWIRVFTIITIGHFTNMQSPLINDHLTFGWIIFAVLMVPVFFIARRLELLEAHESDTGRITHRETGDSKTVSWAGILVVIAALGAGPVWAALAAPAQIESDYVTLELPDRVRGWTGPSLTIWDWQPRYAGVTAERVAEYKSNDATILAYANVYLSQQQGNELVFFGNDIAGSWRRGRSTNDQRIVTVKSAGKFRQVIATSDYGSWLILYRYEVGGKSATSDVRAKILQMFAALRGQPEAGTIAFAIACGQSCDGASTLLTEFVSEIGSRAAVQFQIEES